MSEMKEQILIVPADLVRQCKGIALDMGSSTLKIVYRSKEDAQEVKTEGLKYGHLHLVSFPRLEMAEALEYVAQRADITRSDGNEPPTVYTTGIGCTQRGKTISDKLNIKLEQLTEFDCFVKSFFYLASRLPRTELVESFLEEATVEPLEQVKSSFALMRGLKDQTTIGSTIDLEAAVQGMQLVVGRPSAAALEAGDVPLAEAEPDMFPCMLAMVGSGICFMKINADGSFNLVDASNRGGKTFHGIGGLLTKCKTYNELLDLASKGNRHNVDVFTNDLLGSGDDDAIVSSSSNSEESIYTKGVKCEPSLIFSFGKTIGRNAEEFSREDLALSWLYHVILDLIQCTHYCCLRHDVKRLFFCGGFCTDPLVRQIITTEAVRRNLFQLALPKPGVVQFDFVKPGGHLGALGCLINDIVKK